MKYIFTAQEGVIHGKMGGKAGALAAMDAASFPVPSWFVISPEAFRDSLPEEMQSSFASGDRARLQSMLERLTLSGDVSREIASALSRLSPEAEPLAVRSSALEEDGKEHSFAGQLDSFLFVPLRNVPDRVVDVWRSGFGERVFSYLHEKEIGHVPAIPAVLVQRMIPAVAAGVAFSADPVSGRRGVAVVTGVYGLGSSLVSGECDADTWLVDRGGSIISREIADKRTAHRADPSGDDGVKSEPVPPELAMCPCLTDDQVRAVADLARRAASYFGHPQDIEWALEGDTLYLLQSRPITSLTLLSDPDATLNIWDNSNIVESYGGVTTPLTFSFIRHVYEGVYRQFCRIMAVPPQAIKAGELIYPRMLGMVRGRVYYNLLNWYRLLAMLPGFTVNRSFMEQMMGVKEGIPEAIVKEAVAGCLISPARDRLNLARCILGLIFNYLRLEKNIARFYDRLNRVLDVPTPALDEQRPDELTAHFHMLESELLTYWEAPLVNDFFAMVFYGLLRKLTIKWCGDADGSLQNDLLTGDGGIVSAEPARRVREMAEVAATDEELVEILATADSSAIRHAIASNPHFSELYTAYLAKFSDRCLDELKLESYTLLDDPLPLQRSVGEFARRIRSGRDVRPMDEVSVRLTAEARVRTELAGSPVKRALFAWVLGQARARVRDRENLRFERTRLFGRVRRIFVELGLRFQADGILEDKRDIFWLEKDEIFGFVEGTASCTDLRGLAGVRRAEFEHWRKMEPPPNHFETCGTVNHAQHYCFKHIGEAQTEGDMVKGTGCCPGVVRGKVRLITDPRGAVIREGEILVAERTDPGWIMLFPACSGLLVERGSLLSHSAIVAREMGIPAVVALAGLTIWLKDGDWVEMDGASGTVRKILEMET